MISHCLTQIKMLAKKTLKTTLGLLVIMTVVDVL